MAKVTIYVPDALRDELRRRDLNLSAVCRRAIIAELRREQPAPASSGASE